MKNRILCFVIVCLIIVSISLNVFSVNEVNEINNTNEIANTENTVQNKTLEEQNAEITEKIQESNNKLEYVESELGETLSKVVELNDSINNYQSQYNGLAVQIAETESNIKITQEQIEEIQAMYDKKQKTLKKRVVSLYEAGDSTYIDLLLSSSSLIEFVSNYFMITELVEFDNKLLEEMEDTRIEIEKKKQEQEKQELELRTARKTINETSILLENTKIVKENYMLQLTDEQKLLQEQIAQYKAEQEEIERQIAAAINWTGTMAIQFTGGVMIWPLAMEGTHITSGYGYRTHPIQGVYKKHAGIDISGANVYGAPAVAAADGVVAYAGWISGYGNCVMVNHGNNIISLYGHGSEIVTQTGKTVKQGEIIMRVGSTGNSTGPHLHFEIRKNGNSVDPMPYLNGEITEIIPGSSTNTEDSTNMENTANTENNAETANSINNTTN